MQFRRMGRLEFLVLTLSGLLFGVSSAGAQLLGAEFQANSYETGYQRWAAVTADGAGNFVVVWENDCSYCAVPSISGRRMNADGVPIGSDFPVNSYTTNVAGSPSVAADASGNFVVVWASGRDTAQTGVSGQRFDAAGTPQGAEFQVNSYTTSDQRFPSVARDPSGNFVVVWASFGQDGSGFGVFGQRFSSSGSPLGSEFQVNSHTTGAQFVPSVAMDASGNFVVVWPSTGGQDGDLWGAFGQRFDSAGVAQGPEFQVNSYTTGDQLYPKVAANAAGDFVVVWQSGPQDGDNLGVFGQRFNAAGLPQGGEFQVNTTTTNIQYGPRVAVGPSGSFAVTWTSKPQDGSSDGIFGRRYSSAGVALGGDFQVNVFTMGNQNASAVAADGAGNFVVVWQSPHDGSYTGIFGRQATISLLFGDFELGDTCAWSAAVGSGDVCPP